MIMYAIMCQRWMKETCMPCMNNEENACQMDEKKFFIFIMYVVIYQRCMRKMCVPCMNNEENACQMDENKDIFYFIF